MMWSLLLPAPATYIRQPSLFMRSVLLTLIFSCPLPDASAGEVTDAPPSWPLQPSASFFTGQARDQGEAAQSRRRSEGVRSALSLRWRWLELSFVGQLLKERRERFDPPAPATLSEEPNPEEVSMVPGIAAAQPRAESLGTVTRGAFAMSAGGRWRWGAVSFGALRSWGERGTRWSPSGTLSISLSPGGMLSLDGVYQRPDPEAPGRDRVGVTVHPGRGALWLGWVGAEGGRQGIGLAGALPLSAPLYLLLGGGLDPINTSRYTRIIVGLRWTGESEKPAAESLPLVSPTTGGSPRPGADPFQRLTPTGPSGPAPLSPGQGPSTPGGAPRPLSPLSPGGAPGGPGPGGPPL